MRIINIKTLSISRSVSTAEQELLVFSRTSAVECLEIASEPAALGAYPWVRYRATDYGFALNAGEFGYHQLLMLPRPRGSDLAYWGGKR